MHLVHGGTPLAASTQRKLFFWIVPFLCKTLHYWFHIHSHANMYLIHTQHVALHPGNTLSPFDAFGMRLHLLLNLHEPFATQNSLCSYHFVSFNLWYFRLSSLVSYIKEYIFVYLKKLLFLIFLLFSSFLKCFMFLLWSLLVFYGLPYYFSIVLRARNAGVCAVMRVCVL